ncbi:MAG: hypothetical protein RPT25_11670 [Cycloclasticus sp.]
MMVSSRSCLFFFLLFYFAVCQAVGTGRSDKVVVADIVSMDLIPNANSKELFAGGYRGVLGKIVLAGKVAEFKRISAPLDMDILVIRSLSDDEALIGTAKGEIYRLRNDQLERVALLSEFNEPILDMAVKGDDVWAVGPRGLVANSKDKGASWNVIEIDKVRKELVLGGTEATSWFFGVSNVDADSLVFNATVNGKKAIDDEDYYFNASEGSIEIVNPLDRGSDLRISFNYLPGPQFQAGDVSFNTVSFYAEKVLLAGEFGTVISFDEKTGWRSIYTELTNEESSMPYWMESNVKGQNIILVGAGGVASFSADAGETWVSHNLDNDNGIFDAVLTADSKLIVAGAVGTIAQHNKNQWKLADRSELGLIAWLKSIVSLGDGSYLVSGGRGSMVLFKNDLWQKITLTGAN